MQFQYSLLNVSQLIDNGVHGASTRQWSYRTQLRVHSLQCMYTEIISLRCLHISSVYWYRLRFEWNYIGFIFKIARRILVPKLLILVGIGLLIKLWYPIGVFISASFQNVTVDFVFRLFVISLIFKVINLVRWLHALYIFKPKAFYNKSIFNFTIAL